MCICIFTYKPNSPLTKLYVNTCFILSGKAVPAHIRTVWQRVIWLVFGEWEQYFTFELTRRRRAVQELSASYFSSRDFIVSGIKSRAKPKVSLSWQAISLVSLHFLGEEMGVLFHNFPPHPCGTELCICTTILWPVPGRKYTPSYVCQNTSTKRSREFGANVSFFFLNLKFSSPSSSKLL